MNLGVDIEMKSILLSIRPVNVAGLTTDLLLNEQTARIWKNCTLLAELAQAIADPHGQSEAAKLSAEIVGSAAEIKADLSELMGERMNLGHADRLVKKISVDYLRVKKAMADLGRGTDQFWGETIPNLL